MRSQEVLLLLSVWKVKKTMANLYKLTLYLCDLEENLGFNEIEDLISNAFDGISVNCITRFFDEKQGKNVVWDEDIDINYSNSTCAQWENYFRTVEKLGKNDFKEGEYIIYQNGDRFEIGQIKRLCDDGAFVYYSSGETAAKTPFENIHKLTNAYVIGETSLGGVMY